MIRFHRFFEQHRRPLLPLAAAVMLTACLPAIVHAQVRSVYSQGAAGILQQIEKLQTTASVLLIGAHPDDEDSAFIARSARGDHARVAYLSLTRGEGGQNAIGPELFDALGVIRTEELLQARTLDGGRQFFSRAYDFGFSKTLAEARKMWGDREVLSDVVRTIRMFRPLVVYSIFSGTPADGHGHHQYAGWITPQAVRAAADPAQFPEQVTEGLRPWRVLKLYRAAAFGMAGPEAASRATAVIETGRLDPLLGRSYAEIAAQGRDQHETQKMGGPELKGPRQSDLVLIESAVSTMAKETSVFDGIDTSVQGLAGLAGLPGGSLQQELSAIQTDADRAVSGFNPLSPELSVPALADALAQVRRARAEIRSAAIAPDARAEADFLLSVKELDAERALQLASGTTVEAVSDEETVIAGQSFHADVRVFLSHPPLVTIRGVSLKAPAGWRIEPSAGPPLNPIEITDKEEIFTVTVPQDAGESQPYWLLQPRDGWLYPWPADAPRGEPFDPPLVTARVQAEIGGVPVTLVEPLQYRKIDPVRGELRRSVGVVPAVTLDVDPGLLIVSLDRRGRPILVSVRLQNNSIGGMSGTARLEVPAGWNVSPTSQAFSLAAGERTALVFSVIPGKSAAEGSFTLNAAAQSAARTFDRSMTTIAYPHIQTHRVFTSAEAQVRVLDLKVLPVTVGYVMGSGDKVPEALRRMGLPVTLLSDDEMTSGDLSRFDTIVVGVRATEARPGFAAAAARFLDYMRRGGTLIVQYQQPGYEKIAPLPAHMASRVTDETAPVRILAPQHPAFTTPNRITDKDFDGWVQERDLYAFTTFDAGYTPLLESGDPGEAPQDGGEVYAKVGRGQYIYTAYAWFRQLPAGVPGAYRLFANLVSLGAHR